MTEIDQMMAAAEANVMQAKAEMDRATIAFEAAQRDIEVLRRLVSDMERLREMEKQHRAMSRPAGSDPPAPAPPASTGSEQ